MESAFAWIQQLWTFLTSLVPHIAIVRSTHGGVKFVRGRPVLMASGKINWYLPIVTDIEVFPVIEQPVRISPQILTTKDGKTVYVSGLLLYDVVDPMAFATKLWDADSTIDDVCASTMRDVVASRDYDSLRSAARGTTNNALTKDVQDLVKDYGVRVRYARFADFAPCKVVALVHQHSPSQASTTHVTLPGVGD